MRRMPQCSSACEISAAEPASERRGRRVDEVRERRGHRPQLVVVGRAERARAARRASPTPSRRRRSCRMPAASSRISCDRPVRDPLAVGEAAGPRARRRSSSSAVRELGEQPALADARVAEDRRERRAAVGEDGLPERDQPLELGLAADERRVAGAAARRRLGLQPTPARPRTGSALPFASIGSCSRYSIACARRAVGLLADEDAVRPAPPTRCARPCSARRPTRSPCPRSACWPWVTITSPVAIADPDLDLADRVLGVQRRRPCSRMASAARTARSGSSSCATGDAEVRHDRVADVLLDRAAVPLELGAEAARSRARAATARPRGRAARRALVEPTRSTKTPC